MVLRAGYCAIIGTDHFYKLGICIIQQPLAKNTVDCVYKKYPIKNEIVEEFPVLTTCIGKSKTVSSNQTSTKNRAHQQKGEKVPIQPQTKVEVELEKLLVEKQLENCPIVETRTFFLQKILLKNS